MTSLRIDLQSPSRPNNPVWSFGASIPQTALLLRHDVRRHVRMCRDELGLRHIAMQALQLGNRFDFNELEPIFDWLLETGIVPFVHAAPAAAADPDQWRELVAALVQQVDGRYGCDAREWYFEVGKADLSNSSGGPFATFDKTVREIKKIHPEYRAGFRIADAEESLDALLRHIVSSPEDGSTEPRSCDFLTLGGGANAGHARQKLSAALGQGTPLIVVGYEAPGAGDGQSDDCNHAAFVARTSVELADVCQGVLHDAVSDINDAALQGTAAPFHAGRGLITVNDIRKGAFNSLRLLNEHAGYHGERLDAHWTDALPGLGCLATRSETTLRLLFWLHGSAATAPARFTLEGIPETVSQAQIEVIRPGAGSAYEAWTKLGKPPFVNRGVLDTLELASLAAQADVNFREYPPRLDPGMVMQLTINLPWEEEPRAYTD